MSLTCELWQGATMHGYGQLSTGGLAHRAAYEKAHGAIPPGLLVRHKCDNRLCVNPEHLELGTHEDNYHDAYKQGRHTHGTKSNHSTLDDDKVRAIRNSTVSCTILATQYQVSAMTISKIKRGLAWRHVK